MPSMETLQSIFNEVTSPWFFLCISLSHIPVTVKTLLSQRSYKTLLSPSSFCDALFGHFWATVGPGVRDSAKARVIPLLRGMVKDGQVSDKVVGVPVGGSIIEIGAGSGMWADVFSSLRSGDGDGDAAEDGEVRRRTKKACAITKIYGVEPHPQSADALRKRVKQVGLDDIYQVIPVGIESLSDSGSAIEPESVDCIVSILCLCSIPNQAENIKALYKLLKPGGRWYFYEHVKMERGNWLFRLHQRILNIPWPVLIGSCNLCRQTGKTLREAGPWSNIDLALLATEPSYATVPHIIGTLTK